MAAPAGEGPVASTPAHPTLGKPEKVYPYTDREGNILFYVCRFKTTDGKTFRQGHPNGSGWEWSLNGVQPVLYHLPDLWKHLSDGSHSPIWIVEGEKDADALIALGETATCNPMGAGKWRDEFTELLTGARLVYIVADLDDTGDRHARQVWAAVHRVVDEAIILHAPEQLGKGADISDLLEEGYELDSLVTVEPTETALLEGDEASGARLTIQTIETFSAIDEPTADPLLGGEGSTLLSLGGMLVLYGDGGAGKTTMELDLLMYLASGTTWHGLDVPQASKILVIENEGPRGMFRKKTRAKLAAWKGADLTGNVYVLEDPWALFSFDEEGYRDQLRDLIETHGFDIIAAGPVNRLGMKGGGTPDEVGAFILNIELLRARLDRPVAVIFAHHENKAGDVSGAWEGVPDTLAHISNQGHGHTRCHWQKCRWGPELHGKTWNLLWRDGESFELDEKVEYTDRELEDSIVHYIASHPGASWNAVESAIEGQANRKKDARIRLLTNGLIENHGKGKTFQLYPAGATLEESMFQQDSAGSQSDPLPASGSGGSHRMNAGENHPGTTRLPEPGEVVPTPHHPVRGEGGEPTAAGTDADATNEETHDPDADIPF